MCGLWEVCQRQGGVGWGVGEGGVVVGVWSRGVGGEGVPCAKWRSRRVDRTGKRVRTASTWPVKVEAAAAVEVAMAGVPVKVAAMAEVAMADVAMADVAMVVRARVVRADKWRGRRWRRWR